MSDHGQVHTILLLPHLHTREALLAPGAPVCDPTFLGFGWVVWPGLASWTHNGAGCSDSRQHLVLARDGKAVLEGVDRLARVHDVLSHQGAEKLVNDILSGDPSEPETAREFLSSLGLLVLLNEQGWVFA